MGHLPRVVIVDDHPLWRRALREALASEAWVGEIIEAASVTEAMQVVERDDVVAMDIYLPDGDGTAAARELLRRCPNARVVILTMSPNQADFDRAVAAGIQGYVVKDADPDTIVEALRTVTGGGSFLNAHPVALATLPPSAALPPPFDKLTSRERTILARVITGDTGERIARHLGITHQHVRNTLTRIYMKLGVDGRMRAAMLMREKGIDRLD
jgi:two-component system, NarL family, nitrate/nitrite response regulator NarL